MASENDSEKSLEKIRKRLDELERQLEDEGIKVNKLYELYELSACGHPVEDCDDCRLDANCNDLVGRIEINALYENLPVTIDGLSFHDIDCNEMALMDLVMNSDDNLCSIIHANEIFVHTFLENCG